VFRGDTLYRIINQLDEVVFDKGFTEVIRTGAFITKITCWETSAKLKKLCEMDYTRPENSPFVSSVVYKVYDIDGGSVVSTTTTSITRNGNKQITDSNVVTVRS
jgi:hypothetical protein